MFSTTSWGAARDDRTFAVNGYHRDTGRLVRVQRRRYARAMCGRYALYGPISRHRKNQPIDELPEWYPGLVDAINARLMRFNVAPTDVMPIVGTSREGAITLKALRWGLVPYWAKDVKICYKAINARVETVADKPMFREAFKRRRCLVPASGYFEWKPEGAAKQPHFIHDDGSEPLMFAGLWES
jgi:putative SOS response-associated peptidase YedK